MFGKDRLAARLKHDVGAHRGARGQLANGNGLQEQGFLDRDYASVYTKPDTTDNRSTFLNFTTRHRLNGGLCALRQRLLPRHPHRHAQRRHQRGLARPGALPAERRRAGGARRRRVTPASRRAAPTPSNTPFPSWRCIGNVLLNDEPAEKCNGLINRTETSQHNGGAFAQLTLAERRRARPQPVHGRRRLRSQPRRLRAVDRARLSQSRSQRHRRQRLRRRGDRRRGRRRAVRHARRSRRTDPDVQPLRDRHAVTIADAWNITLSGRYNRTTIRNRDAHRARRRTRLARRRSRVQPLQSGGRRHLQPVADAQRLRRLQRGQPRGDVDRAGCADPEEPCKLPNAMAGDPPLDQVVTRTWEAGARGEHRGVSWNAGLFRAGQPRRHPVRHVRADRLRLLQELRRDAPPGVRARCEPPTRPRHRSAPATRSSTRRSRAKRPSTARATAPTTPPRTGAPGLEGAIEIEPGDRIPLIPRHMFKAFADVQLTSQRVAGHRSRGGVELVRARQREQPARARRHLLSRARHALLATRS